MRFAPPASALAFVLLPFVFPRAQQPAPPAVPAQSADSLATSLHRARTHQLHILYIHGMAAGGTGDFDSWGLRKSICDQLGDCTSAAGEMAGHEYADQGEFALNAPAPGLKYLGESVWRTPEEWNAAAPFVIHWKLDRTSGSSVYVDEIDWWPLVFSLKCRRIIQHEAGLVGPLEPYLSMCSHSQPDAEFPGRYSSYPWIAASDAAALRGSPSGGARLNRSWKASLLDWGISDAVMAVGALRPYLLDGIRQLVLKSVNEPSGRTRGIMSAMQADAEYVIVSHSLGSYLIFAALDIRSTDVNANTSDAVRQQFANILRHTSLVYFFANQVSLLELSDLDTSSNMLSHLQAWADLRTGYLQDRKLSSEGRPQIIAFSDPSDLLSWNVPPLGSVTVRNIKVRNARHWFWIFENPARAHDRYAQNKQVIRQMMK